jgi:hypothetical protein
MRGQHFYKTDNKRRAPYLDSLFMLANAEPCALCFLLATHTYDHLCRHELALDTLPYKIQRYDPKVKTELNLKPVESNRQEIHRVTVCKAMFAKY